ncbi:hypothetical protein ACFOKF_18025 [Sphingobium rhizovicinum]|uniref:Uncharacterized protein n=1 Tax=Sphingobium rhizovicinum TaxID=432308 RepID=A0ABV7NJ45_9SPHN
MRKLPGAGRGNGFADVFEPGEALFLPAVFDVLRGEEGRFFCRRRAAESGRRFRISRDALMIVSKKSAIPAPTLAQH